MKHTDNCFVELQALAEVIWTKKRRERKSDFFVLVLSSILCKLSL